MTLIVRTDCDDTTARPQRPCTATRPLCSVTIECRFGRDVRLPPQIDSTRAAKRLHWPPNPIGRDQNPGLLLGDRVGSSFFKMVALTGRYLNHETIVFIEHLHQTLR
jgi:hypothetical protein